MFEKIISHQRIKTQLQRDINAQSYHQAYLFAGPEHVGKMSLLQEFISQIRTGKAFDKNSSLGKQILAGQGEGLLAFLDNGESLKVEEIRKLSDFVSMRTASGQISFCIIEHLERMSKSAANAFLKILEEPSERFVYLMTTREERKLLPTIRSRVQFYRFTTIPSGELKKYLHEQLGNEVKIQEILKLAAGKIGFAVAMLKDQALLDRMRELYDFAAVLFEDDLVDRFTLAEHLSSEDFSAPDLQQFLVYLALRLKQQGSRRYLRQLGRVQDTRRLFKDTQVNKRMQLEGLFLEI